jgi:hypothetical protein
VIQRAECIRLIPKRGKGNGVICDIHTSPGGEISFLLHKLKYIYDTDKRMFCKLRYPGDVGPPLSTYQGYKGLRTDKDLAHVAEQFGRNTYHHRST